MNYDLIAGLDIGNGFVKGTVADPVRNASFTVDIPSTAAIMVSDHDLKTEDADAGALIKDIFQSLDVSFDSPLVKEKNRWLLGKRAVHSGMSLLDFDLYSGVSKAKQELSPMLILSAVAGSALRNFYEDKGQIPSEDMNVSVTAALALPIGEFKHNRDSYAKALKDGQHKVTVHNFDRDVTITVVFSDVMVVAEGASAQYAIAEKGEPFIKGMLDEVRALGVPYPGVLPSHIMNATGVMGVDIGEGTVNFPVIENGRFNTDVSVSFARGYGSVLESARQRLQDAGFRFKSRRDMQDFLNQPETPINQARKAAVKRVVDEEITGFVTEIALQFSQVMGKIASYVEVVYVYGGGASALRSELWRVLLDKSRAYGGGDVPCPILYLDSSYSRFLNREGLFAIAKSRYKK